MTEYLKQNKKIMHLLEKNKMDKAVEILDHQIASNKNIGLNLLIKSEVYMYQRIYLDAVETLEKYSIYARFIEEEYLLEILKRLGEFYFLMSDYKKSFAVF